MKFFVWVSKERWGFVVLPILRDQEELYKGAETFFDFEDDTWELNFFDLVVSLMHFTTIFK